MIWQSPTVTNEFCRTLLVLATLKSARNQMFTARFVPNMYLFGTFSAQYATEIAPLFLPFPGREWLAGRVRAMAPRLQALGRAGVG
jgi:hypothetical protein